MITLVKLWDRRVFNSPDTVAIATGEDQITFAELDERASILAKLLRARGVGPETLVGVCVERSIPMAVAAIGTLKAGGAFVPLDPRYPKDLLRHLVSDSGVRLVLCDSPTSTPIPGDDIELFGVDKLHLIAETGRVAPLVEPDNLASVIYRSAATGRPKAVAITHASTVNFLRGMTKRPSRTPLPFDLSTFQTLAATLATQSPASTWRPTTPWRRSTTWSPHHEHQRLSGHSRSGTLRG